MKSIDKFVLVLVASLALLLAGCGGGSSTPPDPVDPGPTPQEMAISDAKTDLMTAQDAVAGSADMLAAQQAVAEAAQDLIDVLMANGGTDQDLTDARKALNAANMAVASIVAQNNIMSANDGLTTAQGQLSGATTDAEMLAAYRAIQAAADNLITVLGANGGSADAIVAATVTREKAAGMISSLTQKISDAADAAAAAELAAMIKKFGTKNAAMDAEKDQTAANDGGLGGSAADGTPVTTTTIAISRDRSGTEVKITDSTMNGDDDPKYMPTNVSDGLTKHVRTHKADDDGNVMEETAMVMTDIAAPKATPFAMVAGQALNARDLDATVDADGNGTATDDFTALTVAQDGTTADGSTANFSKVMSTAFPTTRAVPLNFIGDTPSTPADEAEEFRGSYNGAMGKYRCDAGTTGCTVTIADTNTAMAGAQLGITAMSGWVFIPDAGATSDIPDSMYHHYGFWIKKTTDSDDVVKYDEVETFYGVQEMLVQDTTSLTGTAKYSGGALGVYTHKVLDAAGETTAASGGHFTADANLTANFTGTSIAQDDHNTVTGTIKNFMLSGGEPNNWSVSLKGTTTAAGVTGTDWSAVFYGADDDNDSSLDDATADPAAILGEFNAGFANGQVAGAFGADLVEE